MARAIVLSNGEMAVTLDQFGLVRDVYYPYVGMENHVSGHPHRIGLMINDHFSWLSDPEWQITTGYKPETMVGYYVCKNAILNITVVMEDLVYNEANVFMREVSVYNQAAQPAHIKIFFHQVFRISETLKRNTAFYDPTHNVVVHYRGRRVFMVNGLTASGKTIDDFGIGTYQADGKEGTYRDAEDGQLGKNGVEHGSVDSVVRFCLSCEGSAKATLHYWICAGHTLEEAYALNQIVKDKTPAAMMHSTESFWNAWLNKHDFPTHLLTKDQKKLFDTSLFLLRAHFDNRGSVIASADSEMIEYGKDDYTYMWPRDAAFITSVLDAAGYTEVTKPFFAFCQSVMHPDGYLHHRYNSDKSLGSTWHSALAQKHWLKNKILQLPIQEDETASVIYALWKHYERTKDVEFIESLYTNFVSKAAQFLCQYRHQATGLPLPSYDLWEERIGISTYTCTAVYGGLQAAAKLSELLGKRNHMRLYRDTAMGIKEATIKYLYNQDRRSFIRQVVLDENDQIVPDNTIDSSSLYGLWYYQMLEQSDPLFITTAETVAQTLTNPTAIGGRIRYEHDVYFRDHDQANPWFITTLWEVQRVLNQPEVTTEDMEYAHQVLNWCLRHMYPSGILAEQLDPDTGFSKSATPLVWSHAMYIETVLLYLKHQAQRRPELASSHLPTSCVPLQL